MKSLVALLLALNWKAEPQFGGFYAAGEHFQKAGLQVQILEGGSGTPTVQMLVNGKTDYAIVSAEEILIANERNPKNRVLAVFAVYQTNPQMIMCHADKKFASLRDVYASTATLAQQSGLTYAQYLKNKYPKSRVRVVPYLGGITNFLADPNFCQQGFITSEPLAAEKAGAKVTPFLIAHEGFNPYTTVLAVREDTWRKDPDQVKRVVRAVRAGWNDYLKNPQPANQIMQGLNKSMDAETFRKSAEAQIILIRDNETEKKGLGLMTAERWTELIRQLRELKVLKKDVKAGDVFLSL
ncbi:MAG: ABC transporter substrate-binding protein [Bdellovibrionaceae bacterium]|nr:ABC transporter substrate-binding protein [Pseudobdellovibrionaceae bacterium]